MAVDPGKVWRFGFQDCQDCAVWASSAHKLSAHDCLPAIPYTVTCLPRSFRVRKLREILDFYMHPFSREPSSQVCAKRLTHTTLTCFSGKLAHQPWSFQEALYKSRAGGGSLPTLLLGAIRTRIHFFIRSWYQMHGMTETGCF